jgi:hypothetical protein
MVSWGTAKRAAEKTFERQVHELDTRIARRS